ncbi:MAG: hypothetical protein NC228_07660, partial [[Eubacterium] siraeum]|nr:hypothetical protein [[Eubacterium] siraeum]
KSGLYFTCFHRPNLFGNDPTARMAGSKYAPNLCGVYFYVFTSKNLFGNDPTARSGQLIRSQLTRAYFYVDFPKNLFGNNPTHPFYKHNPSPHKQIESSFKTNSANPAKKDSRLSSCPL